MKKLIKKTIKLTGLVAGGLFIGTAIKTGKEAGSLKEGFKIIERPVDELKGIHLKMNDYYETNENKIEKPDYIIYESSETNLSGPDKFIDSVQQREQMPVGWGQKVEFNVPDNMVSRYENSNPIIRKYEEDIDSIIASNKITIQGLK